MTEDSSAVLHLRTSKTGSLRIDSELDFKEFCDLEDRVNAQNGKTANVSARHQGWAGPYELYLAIQPLVDTVAGMVGAGTGLAALLMELARRKPDQPIHVHVENNVTIVVDGKRELTDDEISAIERLAEENDQDPNGPDWRVIGAGQ